jgi:hypothetical protein
MLGLGGQRWPNINGRGPPGRLPRGWFPAEKANFSGEIVSKLTALIDTNTIRVLDLAMITRADDRSVETTEMRDSADREIAEPRPLERDLAILRNDEESRRSARRFSHTSTTAAAPVWEHTWAAPFGWRCAGPGTGRLGSGRIPTRALIASVAAGRQAALEGAWRWDCSGIEVSDPGLSGEVTNDGEQQRD